MRLTFGITELINNEWYSKTMETSGVAIIFDLRVGGSRDPRQRCRPTLPHSFLRGRYGRRRPLAHRRQHFVLQQPTLRLG